MNEPTFVTLREMKVIGIHTETKNSTELTEEAKIAPLWNTYMTNNIGLSIPNQLKQAPTIAIYSNYENDETGKYMLTIGKEVVKTSDVPTNMVAQTIPGGRYAIFTSRKGVLPEIVFETWQYIWQWSKENARAFTYDFEFYDERYNDPTNCQVEIYVAMK
ncbi:GyrI-like domain-containing protein [Priestia taiwanensis]|uniref:DNA-binding protein n=1 Tax=Priestia taiwanensis TaxID=1347902 RepID=A0A917AI86_9BACI|nr:GyrI-like domain-containing protein [Priestia taiwanensis]MBM7361627.1 putative transcriptional regulator YdeE [Priestia taiwanensis]GGE55637.1 DNA-binding protein [Priestia taiwanensis]